MANAQEIAEKVLAVFDEQLDLEPGTATAESHIIDDLGADSLDSVEVLMRLEETFGVEFPDDEAENVTTVQNAIDYIVKALS